MPTGRESIRCTGHRGIRNNEIDIHLQVASLAAGAGITELPFAARMLRGHAPDRVSLPGKDRLQGLLDPGPFQEHRFPVRRTHVIEIDIHREAGNGEDEKVQGRAALEDQLVLEEGMAADGIEQLEQQRDLFQHVRAKAGCLRLDGERFRGDLHEGSSHDLS